MGMNVKFLVSLVFTVCMVWAAELKLAKDDPNCPPWIAADYIQVEPNDFGLYFEWWAQKDSDNKYQRVLLTTENNSITSQRDDLQSYDKPVHNEIYPIHNENRFIFVKNLEETGQCDCELYDILNLRPDIKTPSFITANNHDTYPSKNEYAFMCHKWWIVNSTHALDVVGLYESNINVDNSIPPTTKTLIQAISTIENDACFSDPIREKLDQCFNKNQYCAIDYDNGYPQLVISEEHVIQIHKGIQLLQRYMPNDDHYKSTPYYVLKYKHQYYYFPNHLQTFNTSGSHLSHRVSMLPRFHHDDGFLTRIDPNRIIPSVLMNQIIFINPKIYINNAYMQQKN